VTAVASTLLNMLVWGVIATAVMVSVMAASQNLGWSRLSMAFLIGSAFTANRRSANVVGTVLYFIGGWLFAFFYYLFFSVLGRANEWLGAAVGLVHGVLLLAILLPLMPYMHPRMASEYDGPSGERRLEPPGFLALHYGSRTPLAALVAHVLYGAILGYGFRI
jgi:hypothetical protein